MGKDKEAPAPRVDPDTLKSNEIARKVFGAGLQPEDFRVEYNDGRATLRGRVRSEDDRKRVLDAVRSAGVSTVTDTMTINTGAPSGGLKVPGATASPGAGAGRSYTVKSGDTLSAIAKTYYGDASKYNKIFEANRNILKDADEIQPGQVLNIPE